jgi:hypothetical protein
MRLSVAPAFVSGGETVMLRKTATEVIGRPKQVFRVRMLGMTGRVAVLLLVLMLLPMLLTSWMIEQGWLLPGKNLYCAVPIFLIILIEPWTGG